MRVHLHAIVYALHHPHPLTFTLCLQDFCKAKNYNLTWTTHGKLHYPEVLGVDGQVRRDVAREWIKWYCLQPGARAENLKKAKAWLKYVINFQLWVRVGNDAPQIDGESFWESLGADARSATAKLTVDSAASRLEAGESIWSRCDKPLGPDTVTRMMCACLECDATLHPSVLRCLQLRFEFAAVLRIGCRGQILRKARMGMIRIKHHDICGEGGIQALIIKNCDGDKTHATGDAVYFGAVPCRDAQHCTLASLGLALLYRFSATTEPFPSVKAERTDKVASYVWRPLLRSGTQSQAAQFIDDASQNSMFNALYVSVGHLLSKQDGVTHVKSQCVSEAQAHGVRETEIDRALFVTGSVKEQHYDPEMALSFMLQRAMYGADARDATMPAHLKVVADPLVAKLVDSVMPGLVDEEGHVAEGERCAIAMLDIESPTAKKRKEAHMLQKRFVADKGVHDARMFCDAVRYCASVALCALAARPRAACQNGIAGAVLYDEQPLFRKHVESRAFSKAHALRLEGILLTAHPLFLQLCGLVHAAEESERPVADLTPRTRRIVEACCVATSAQTQQLREDIKQVRDAIESSSMPPPPPPATPRVVVVGTPVPVSTPPTITTPNSAVTPPTTDASKIESTKVMREEAETMMRVPEFGRYVDVARRPNVRLLWKEYYDGSVDQPSFRTLEHERGDVWRKHAKAGWSRASLVYREIARQYAKAGGDIQVALDAVQKRVLEAGAWRAFADKLQKEQTSVAERNSLRNILESM